MIVHKTVGITEPLKTVRDGAEKFDEIATVFVAPEDLLPGVAAGGDMIQAPGYSMRNESPDPIVTPLALLPGLAMTAPMEHPFEKAPPHTKRVKSDVEVPGPWAPIKNAFRRQLDRPSQISRKDCA